MEGESDGPSPLPVRSWLKLIRVVVAVCRSYRNTSAVLFVSLATTFDAPLTYTMNRPLELICGDILPKGTVMPMVRSMLDFRSCPNNWLPA